MLAQSQLTEQRFSIGRGSIGPNSHIAAGEYSVDTLNEFTKELALSDQFYDQIYLQIPVHCADGRTRLLKGASAIGGSFSSVAADALGPQRYYLDGMTAKDHALGVYDYFTARGISIGGHDDEHASGFSCGCGGEDKFGPVDPNSLCVLSYLRDYAPDIKQVLEGLVDSQTGRDLGLNINEDHEQIIIGRASGLCELNRTKRPYATGGKDLRQAMIKAVGTDAIETLHGLHREVALVLDFRDNIGLNRAKLSEAYDNKLQAFYVNIAGLKKSADLLYETTEQKELAFTASLYYNLAAAAVLSDPSLGIITRT